jgi:threonine/homoserine/homoserine lactone efflux protein
MAVSTVRDKHALTADETAPRSAAKVITSGVLVNLLNPKLTLFFFAFLPQFVDPASAHATRDLVFLGVLYAALALPVKGGVALAAGSFAERILRSPAALTWINRAGGTVLVALGARLAAAERA